MADGKILAGDAPCAPGFSGPALDRLALHELNHAYSDAVTRHDIAAFRALWAPDAVWVHPDFEECSGIERIMTTIGTAFEIFPFVAMISTLGTLQVGDGDASGTVYIDEVVRIAEGEPAYRVKGVYRDRYVRREGVWLFARRDYALLYRS